MSQHDDISWETLRRITREWAGDSAELSEVRPLVGGCINTTLLLKTKAGDCAVLKISPHRVNREYAREARQLELFRSIGLPSPRIHAVHVADLDNPDSYLLMECLPGVPFNVARQACSPEEYDTLQQHLAELIAVLHATTAEQYGRVGDGAEPQPTYASWPAFFRAIYEPILPVVDAMHVIPIRQRKVLSKLDERLERLLAHGDVPRLAHGDLWSTNLLADRDGDGRWHVSGILDPNCKYAHHEYELAYLDLFHTSTPAFKKAYRAHFPLSDDYHKLRKPIYQLYPLLNHVQLFGHEYVKPLLAAIDKVAPLV
jgi:fructosamine-3-kinase